MNVVFNRKIVFILLNNKLPTLTKAIVTQRHEISQDILELS